MLGIFVIAGCVLMTCAGPPTSGYSLGTLSGGRGQEYSSGYRTGGFVGIKDSQGDYNDHAGSHRYSVVGTGASSHSPTAGSGYSTDSGYSDAAASHTFAGHNGNVVGNPDATSGLASSSSYNADSGSHGTSSDATGVGYSASASGSSSGGVGNYATGGASGIHGNSGFVGYTELAGSGHGATLSSGLSSGEHGEYSSSQHPSNSYVTYNVGGPKTSAYTATSGHGNHAGHGPASYSSNPGMSFVSTGGHHRIPSSVSSSSYPSESSHSSGPSYSSGPSLNSFLASMHGNGPSNYIPHSSGGHRGHHLFTAASNPSPSYSSMRGPGYFSNSPYPRGGGKIIIVKESGGGHAGHPSSSMYPVGGEHSYGGGMFGGGPSYKIRSVGSGYGSASFPSGGYSSSLGSHNAGPSHSSNNGGGSFFSFL